MNENVMSVDPGIMTGFCTGRIEVGKLKYRAFQATDEVDDFWRRLRDFKPRYLIIEDFQFRQGKYKTGVELFPVQLIGIARLYSLIADHPVALYIQSAAQGKSYYTNPVLQSDNLYVRGIPHGMDASRHLLQWFTFGAGFKYAGSKRVTECVELVNGP